jgi:hypothetical protein
VQLCNLIRALAERGQRVTLSAPHLPSDDADDLSKLRGWCQSVQVI